MKNTPKKFYDDLADDYHLIFENWEKSCQRQAQILDKIIRGFIKGKRSSKKLLDCSCGIGTQSLGLAQKGYEVWATDISSKAIHRAKKEAKKCGVEIQFAVADMRELSSKLKEKFDIIISCDNSLPHIVEKKDVLLALKNIYSQLETGGSFVASIRDYDAILKQKPSSTSPAIFDNGKRIVFQTWKWKSENVYDLHHFILSKQKTGWETKVRTTQYSALLRSEISDLLKKIGFTKIIWKMPNKTKYYQPIVIATK